MYRLFLSVMILIGSFSTAYAIGSKTRTYCAYDYLRHCSAYSLSSPDLGKCMANIGINLSKKCIQALVDDGIITKEEVIARAAKQGIVVRDGDKGLYIDENAKVGEEVVTVEMPKEEIKTQDVGIETAKVIESIDSGAKTTYENTKKTIQKAYTKTKKTIQKAVTAVKTKYKQVTKSNKEYAKRSNIAEQNKLRKAYVHDERGIASEGINADFSRYEMRRPGFVPPTKYSFRKHMDDHNNGMIRSEGVNAQFDRN